MYSTVLLYYTILYCTVLCWYYCSRARSIYPPIGAIHIMITLVVSDWGGERAGELCMMSIGVPFLGGFALLVWDFGLIGVDGLIIDY